MAQKKAPAKRTTKKATAKKATKKATRVPKGVIKDQPSVAEVAGGASALGPKVDVPGMQGVEMTAEEVLARHSPTSYTQPICLDGDLADARDEARAAVQELEHVLQVGKMVSNTGVDTAELQREYGRAVAQMKKAEQAALPATAIFRFESIGRAAYAELLRAHPPTPSQEKDYKEKLKARSKPLEPLPYNPETFPPALLSACCVVPRLSPADADQIWHGRPAVTDPETGVEVEPAAPPWSEGECGALFEAALAANRIVR